MCSINDVNIGDEVIINIGRNLIRAEVLAIEEDKVKVRNLANGNEFFTSRLQEVVQPEESEEPFAEENEETQTEEAGEPQEAVTTPAEAKKNLSLINAAVEVLKQENRAMKTKEIVTLAVERGLWIPTSCKTPEQSLYGAIVLENRGKSNPRIIRGQEKGTFVLPPADNNP